MPKNYYYKLRKAPHPPNPQNHYWIVNENGRKFSRDPLPKEQAKAQMRALYARKRSELQGDGLNDILASIFEWLSPSTSKSVKGLSKLSGNAYKTARATRIL